MTLNLLDKAALDQFDQDAPAASPARYGRASMAFHWATLLLIVAMFWSAWAREAVQDAADAARLLMLHRSIGLLVWVVTLLRLAWRGLFAVTPSLPPTVSTAHYVAARANQLALYSLLVLQPITGFLQSIWRGQPFALFALPFPVVVPRDKALSHLFHSVHQAGATAFLLLIGLHALAALFHGLVRRDGVLEAMLPARRSVSVSAESDVSRESALD